MALLTTKMDNPEEGISVGTGCNWIILIAILTIVLVAVVLTAFPSPGAAIVASFVLATGALLVAIVLFQRVREDPPTTPTEPISDITWQQFQEQVLNGGNQEQPGWAWAEDQIAGWLGAVSNQTKTGDGGVDAIYYSVQDSGNGRQIQIPIQVKMQQASVGRPAMDRLLGAQFSMQNQGIHAPMSIMVTLYPSSERLRQFADSQGQVSILVDEENWKTYPRMQLISVQEMLELGKLPQLPPPGRKQ